MSRLGYLFFLFVPALLSAAEIPLSVPAMDAAPFERTSPRVASNGEGFLAVWYDERRGPLATPEIRAARLDPSGKLLDPKGILVATKNGRNVAVASDGRDYVVAYDCEPSNFKPRICTARIDVNRAVVEHGLTLDAAMNPGIASDGKNYLLAYQTEVARRLEVNAVELSRDAQRAGSPFRIARTNIALPPDVATNGDSYFVVWNGFADLVGASISGNSPGPLQTINTTRALQGPSVLGWSVASDGDGYVVVWQQNRGIADFRFVTELHAAAISRDGVVGERRTVLTEPERTWNPSIEWGGGKYVVTYTHSSERSTAPYLWYPSETGIHMVELDASGDRISAPAVIADRLGHESFSSTASSLNSTIVVFDHQFRAEVWTGDEYEPAAWQIEAKLITPAGDPTTISNSTTWQQSVTGTNIQGTRVIAWEEILGEEQRTEVFVQRIRADDTVLDGRGVAVDVTPNAAEQIHPAIDGQLVGWAQQAVTGDGGAEVRIRRLRSDGPLATDATPLGRARRDTYVGIAAANAEHLVVWESPENSIIAVRVGANGVLDLRPIIVGAGQARVWNAEVASDGENYLVTWRMNEPQWCMILCQQPPTSIYAALVTRSGAVLPAIQVAPAGVTEPTPVWNGKEFAVVFAGYDVTANFSHAPSLKVRRISRTGVPLDPEPVRILSPALEVRHAIWTGGGYVVALSSYDRPLEIARFRSDFIIDDVKTAAPDYVPGTDAVIVQSDTRILMTYQRRNEEGISRIVGRRLSEAETHRRRAAHR